MIHSSIFALFAFFVVPSSGPISRFLLWQGFEDFRSCVGSLLQLDKLGCGEGGGAPIAGSRYDLACKFFLKVADGIDTGNVCLAFIICQDVSTVVSLYNLGHNLGVR